MGRNSLEPNSIMMHPVPADPATSSSLRTNSRRPPAHRSVSLLHWPRPRPAAHARNGSSSSDSNAQTRRLVRRVAPNHSSPSSLQPLGGKDSSGESSNADKWFEKSNNEPTGSGQAFIDNEPPFFMNNSSSGDTPPDQRLKQRQQQQHPLRQTLKQQDMLAIRPMGVDLLQFGNDESSTEDFRGVIDDLTIQNKKLRRRLKKYEKLHDSHLKDEKLFEVRIHGLPADKKHELEETLRKFAASLSAQPGQEFPLVGNTGIQPLLPHAKTASSQTSIQNPDSAYASMSASGQGSSAQSGTDWKGPRRPNAKQMHQNVHSYLHHIPEGFLSHPVTSTLSERAKKKLVVRRLEQIFAGKGAVGGHQQMLQQQEVSQIAARAEKTELEAAGQTARREGQRESAIMDQETEDPLDRATMQNIAERTMDRPTVDGESANRVKHLDFSIDTNTSLEQRPTRPLDLDPHRAQVPSDNIWYIRHLGFSPPSVGSEEPLVDGHGWIYLNLLTNMAQLHTLNVTADFVRKALQDISNKFEMSDDGRKVRWKGGSSVTRTSSNEGGSSYERTGDDTPDGLSPRKRQKLVHGDNSVSSARPALPHRLGSLQRGQPENNKFVYTPMFFHKDSTDEGGDSSDVEDDSTASPLLAPMGGDSSGMTSSGVRTTNFKAKKREDGPIIFYNNVRFCTDLSGDRSPTERKNVPPYRPVSLVPIGMETADQEFPYEQPGPLNGAISLPEPMDLDDNPIPAELELSFPLHSPTLNCNTREPQPFNFEVSGIGGISPADNFIIAVDRKLEKASKSTPPHGTKISSWNHPPHRLAAVVDRSELEQPIGREVLSVISNSKIKRLPPSELPPALCYMPCDDESYEDDSDADDDMSIAPESTGDFPPSAAPQTIDVPYALTEDEDEDEQEEGFDDDDDNDGSDGSLDLLATAREVDPDAIREREREYDANMAERLAEEIPAGSSAATAGGGSGFASPASGIDIVEYREARKAARDMRLQKRPPQLIKARSSDSLKVQGLTEMDSRGGSGFDSEK